MTDAFDDVKTDKALDFFFSPDEEEQDSLLKKLHNENCEILKPYRGKNANRKNVHGT